MLCRMEQVAVGMQRLEQTPHASTHSRGAVTMRQLNYITSESTARFATVSSL